MDMYFIEKGKKGFVRIAGLMRHLIESHGFFEGGSYRIIAPEKIIEMFGKERVPDSLEKARKLKF